MSYYLPEIFNAISDRLRGDVTLTANATGGIYIHEAPAAQSAPYVVVRLVTAPPANSEGFRLRSRQVVIDVDVFVPSHLPSATDTMVTLGAIINRIEGDWDDNATQATTTYGLDRWTPTLGSSGWSCTPMEYVDTAVANEPGCYHYTLTYQVYAHKAGAT